MTKQRYEVSIKVTYRVEAETEAEANEIGYEMASNLKNKAAKLSGDINQSEMVSCHYTDSRIVPSWSL